MAYTKATPRPQKGRAGKIAALFTGLKHITASRTFRIRERVMFIDDQRPAKGHHQ